MNPLNHARQTSFSARFEWGYEGVAALGPGTDILVIIDVLSFTTCVDVVLGRGGIVYPYRVKDETLQAFAREKQAIAAGRRGETISLSPASLARIPTGSRIVLPSPNGATCTVLAKGHGATVIAACLRNASAVGRFLRSHGGSIGVIACGERWSNGNLRPAFEDLYAAGAILRELHGYRLSPEAMSAVATYEHGQGEATRLLRHCASGQELINMGFPEDITLAAMVNASSVVPVLNQDDAYEPM